MTTRKGRGERRVTIISLSSSNTANNLSQSLRSSVLNNNTNLSHSLSRSNIIINSNNSNFIKNITTTKTSPRFIGDEQNKQHDFDLDSISSDISKALSTVAEEANAVDLNKEMAFIKRCMQTQVKQLVKLFILFTFYIVSGMFLFFYIEECSNAGKPGDHSYLHSDILADGEFGNRTELCINLTQTFDNQYNVSNSTSTQNISTINFTTDTNRTTEEYMNFRIFCQAELANATGQVVTKQAKRGDCVVNEFTLLKYAEFTIFTCLTIGNVIASFLFLSVKYTQHSSAKIQRLGRLSKPS